MFVKLSPIGQCPHPLFAAVLPICLLLSACGGDGTSVANIPPPPTPTPTPTPSTAMDIEMTWPDRAGTQVGTYDLFGRLSSAESGRALAPGEFAMTVAKSGDALSYALSGTTITAKSPEIFWNPSPNGYGLDRGAIGGKWDQFLGQRIIAYHINDDGSKEESASYDFTRGSVPASLRGMTFTYDVGNSYVAMGEWAWPVDLHGNPSQELLFVNGDRTPAAGIPVSGKASYNAHALSLLSPAYDSAHPGLPFTLTADFAQRTVSTRIDQDYQHYLEPTFGEFAIGNQSVLGIHVEGSAPFNNDGTWDIPLMGTVNFSATNAVETPPSEAVTGSMDGAFFGPHAEAVGGTFFLDRGSGQPLIQDAFVGQQQP